MKLKRDTDTRLCSTTRRFRRLLPSPLVLHVRVLYSLQRVARTPSCREPTAVNLKLKLRCSTSVSLPIISTQNRGALGDIVCLGDERSVSELAPASTVLTALTVVSSRLSVHVNSSIGLQIYQLQNLLLVRSMAGGWTSEKA
eukprot:m.135570 g.135570  ORF g.135570 m.135570 type:complete len:142 (+) comp13907_c0_seq6:84-509(+)